MKAYLLNIYPGNISENKLKKQPWFHGKWSNNTLISPALLHIFRQVIN
jgi:hypothetical protein